MDITDYWTSRDVAEYHGVALGTVAQWVKRGKLHRKARVGPTPLFDPSEARAVTRRPRARRTHAELHAAGACNRAECRENPVE